MIKLNYWKLFGRINRHNIFVLYAIILLKAYNLLNVVIVLVQNVGKIILTNVVNADPTIKIYKHYIIEFFFH